MLNASELFLDRALHRFNFNFQSITPTAQRSATNPGKPLSATVRPLLQNVFEKALKQLASVFPITHSKLNLFSCCFLL